MMLALSKYIEAVMPHLTILEMKLKKSETSKILSISMEYSKLSQLAIANIDAIVSKAQVFVNTILPISFTVIDFSSSALDPFFIMARILYFLNYLN